MVTEELGFRVYIEEKRFAWYSNAEYSYTITDNGVLDIVNRGGGIKLTMAPHAWWSIDPMQPKPPPPAPVHHVP